MNTIEDLLEFTRLTHDARKIKRDLWAVGEDHFENDSEHSHQLALVALYIIEENKLPLDPLRSMSLAVVHDILEVHAGDTPVYADPSVLKSKKSREDEAILKLKKQWPKLKILHQLIAEYETKSSDEARFIYALDKLVPMLNNYLDGGRNWKRNNINIEQVVSIKTGKIDIDPVVNDYYKQIMEILKNKPDLFK